MRQLILGKKPRVTKRPYSKKPGRDMNRIQFNAWQRERISLNRRDRGLLTFSWGFTRKLCRFKKQRISLQQRYLGAVPELPKAAAIPEVPLQDQDVRGFPAVERRAKRIRMHPPGKPP